MDWMKEYIVSIVAVGTVTGICASLVPKHTTSGMIIKMLSGIILVITLISPLVKIRFDDLNSIWEEVSDQADCLAQEGSDSSQEAISLVIKENLESYILDKADDLGVAIQVTVLMDPQDTVMPQSVRLQGAVSPYQKRLLSDFLEDELSIAEAQQVWN